MANIHASSPWQAGECEFDREEPKGGEENGAENQRPHSYEKTASQLEGKEKSSIAIRSVLKLKGREEGGGREGREDEREGGGKEGKEGWEREGLRR